MKNRILVIDDEITENTKTGKNIKRYFNKEGYNVVFAKTWDDDGYGLKASQLLEEDDNIGLIILDVRFPRQKLEGGAIFEEIKRIRPDIPIAILTKVDVYTSAETFLERGAVFYIVKSEFEKYNLKLRNYLRQVVFKHYLSYKIVLGNKTGPVLYLDIENQDGMSLLKRRRLLKPPISTMLLDCIRNDQRICSYPITNEDGTIRGLEPWNRIDIHKEISKFNASIKNGTNGIVPALFKGRSMHGASSFELLIKRVEFSNSQ